MAQFKLAREMCVPGALIVIDDINFSDDMRQCWADICEIRDLAAVWQYTRRVGIVELP